MKHHSPSYLGNLSLCPRWTPSEETNDAAEYGTLFHDRLQWVIAHCKPNEYDREVDGMTLSGEMKSDIKDALRQAGMFLSLGLPVTENAKFTYDMALKTIEPGVYLESSVELWPDDRRHKVGRIDLLVIPSPNVAIIADWKSSRVEADFSWQLDSYAGALKRLVKEPWKQITAKVIAPKLDVHEDIVYDDEALVAREREILGVEERANNPFSPPSPGPAQCKYCECAAKMLCPAYREYVTKGQPTSDFPTPHLSEVAPVVTRPPILKNPRTLEERSFRRDWMTVATAICEFVKEDDKKFFAKPENASAQLPGYRVSQRAGNAYIDRDRLKELNQHLMKELDLGYEELMTSLEPVKEKLVETLALRLGTKKAAEAKYAEVTEQFTKRGAPITTIAREVPRRLPKIQENE